MTSYNSVLYLVEEAVMKNEPENVVDLINELRNVELINELRKEEGACVTIFCDNPDFNGEPNVYVEVTSDWTDFKTARFGGDTLVKALETAAEAKKKHGGQA